MRTKLLTAALAAALTAGVTAGGADAAPIDCPNGQTAVHDHKVDGDGHGGHWDCVNRGGNTSNAEDPKNPNKGKGDF